MSNFASGKNAKAVSDRNGLTYPYSEMVVEPGTGLFVHFSESDGMYNIVDHPQNYIKRVFADSPPVQNPRPSPWYELQYITQDDNTSAQTFIWFDSYFGAEEAIWTGFSSVVNR